MRHLRLTPPRKPSGNNGFGCSDDNCHCERSESELRLLPKRSVLAKMPLHASFQDSEAICFDFLGLLRRFAPRNAEKKSVFTLAEVLLTLTIIGIVAAITLPALQNSINKQDTVAKVKKAYTVLSQATLAINNDCGGTLTNCLSTPNAGNDDNNSRQEVAALYKSKLLVNKDCTGSGTGCFANKIYKYLSGNDYTNIDATAWSANARLLLNDGSAVAFDWNGGGTSYFVICVDINGPQPPNQLGKDVFMFYYDSTSGIIKLVEWDSCTTSDNGYGCAARILKEGAINYY